MAEVELNADDFVGSLDEAFARLIELEANEARLRIPRVLRPDHKMAEALRDRLHGVPSLRRVVLVHPSPAVRFLASSLSLLVPDIQFDVVTGGEPGEPGEPPPPSPSPPATAIPPSTPGVVRASISSGDEQERDIEAMFERAGSTRARAIVLTLDRGRPIDRTLVGLLADGLHSLLGLQLVVLVHPSPAAGFLASTLGLRCPRVRVLACAAEDEVDVILATRL